MHSQSQYIAHFDLDSFFVSVERLKDPSLIGKPVAVGGASGRGVVASCSYEARKFGVRSAMPGAQAKRLCPELITVKGDGESYSYYSRLVTEIINSRVPVFEKASIDEFYIDMSGMDRFFGVAEYVRELRRLVEKESGLNISYGLAVNKLVAKVATDEAKPRGQLEIPAGREKAFLAPLAVEKIPMVGNKTTGLLKGMGVHTVHQLSLVPLQKLIEVFGRHGVDLHRKSQGLDNNVIVPYREAKSIGTENTFHADTADLKFLDKELARMTEAIAFELRNGNRLTGCVTVKLRYSDFETFTKQAVVPYTASDHMLLSRARELFNQLYRPVQQVRLIGIRFSHLIPGNYQINLFEDKDDHLRLYQAMDNLKGKFGEQIIHRGSAESYQAAPKELRFIR